MTTLLQMLHLAPVYQSDTSIPRLLVLPMNLTIRAVTCIPIITCTPEARINSRSLSIPIAIITIFGFSPIRPILKSLITHPVSFTIKKLTVAPVLVKDGDVIRLQHFVTEKRLHSHDVRPPMTEADWQNEVSGYGFPGFAGDANDFFRVKIVKSQTAKGVARERLRYA